MQMLTTGQFVYIPIGTDYRIDSPEAGTQLLTFHKVYEKLEGMTCRRYCLGMPPT